jgi:hypothetical protein
VVDDGRRQGDGRRHRGQADDDERERTLVEADAAGRQRQDLREVADADREEADGDQFPREQVDAGEGGQYGQRGEHVERPDGEAGGADDGEGAPVPGDGLDVAGEPLYDAGDAVGVGVAAEAGEARTDEVAVRAGGRDDDGDRRNRGRAHRAGDVDGRPAAPLGAAGPLGRADGCQVDAGGRKREQRRAGQRGDGEQIEDALDGQGGKAARVRDVPAGLHDVGPDGVAGAGREHQVPGLADEDGPREKADALAVPQFGQDVAVPEPPERPRQQVDDGRDPQKRRVGAPHRRQHCGGVEVDGHQRDGGDHEPRSGGHRDPAVDPRLDRQLPPQPDEPAAHPEDVPDEVDGGVARRRPLDGELPDVEAGPLGADQHLGVPEPVVVIDVAEESEQGVAVERLEAALVVVQRRPEHQPHERVVAGRGDPALGVTGLLLPRDPPGAGGHVVPRRANGLDQLLEVRHLRREVGVEVHEDVALARAERAL